MGGKNSREAGRREFSSYGSGNSSAWDQYNYPPQSPYVQQYPYTEPSEYGSQTPQQPQRRLDRKYSRIADNYQSLDEVTAALIKAGLESSNLIVGIDFTKSNEWTGSRSFNRRSLHHIGNEPNPYEQAISIIGQTLSSFDDDNMIPCFGFGDASTHDQDVFSFYHDDRICNGFEEVLHRYREIVPDLRLAGPTSFAPIIEMAMTIVDQTGGQYHVLLIIADGQVTRSVDTHNGQLSLQERKTIDAIVRASEYPLSIVLVGVGDGPWDTMKEFDDNIPARAFDNFQFVNFTEMMSNNVNNVRRHADFCLAALMEIPSQYQATLELGILGYAFTLCNLRFNGLFVEFINAISLLLMSRRQIGSSPERVPLPPPLYSATSSSGYPGTPRSNSFQTRTSSLGRYNQGVGTNPSSSSSYDNQRCPICIANPKDMAFGCGHMTCCNCGGNLELCPICRSFIQTRIRLY